MPQGNPQLAIQYQQPATTHPSEPQLEVSLPTEHRGLALLIVPDSKRALAPLPKSKNARFPTKGRKAINCHTAGGI
jgi:hypothetical protein